MGIFDFFKAKSPEEKNLELFNKLRLKSIVHEKESVMKSMIMSSPHDNSSLDEDPRGEGEFGLTKTNPIPVYGVDNIHAYMDKIRYKYTSKSGTFTYNPVDFQRTLDTDESKVGSKKPLGEGVGAATSSSNIKGHIDVYNLYSLSGEKLAKIYVNCYALKTSNKTPKGFFHRDDIPILKDAKILIELAAKNRS